MIYSPWGILISLGLIALVLFLYYNNFKPKFIFPTSKLSLWKYWVTFFSGWIVCIAAILLPLHLGFVSDKNVDIQKATPVQIVLDVSLSMAATDMSPSRFSLAKTYLVDTVKRLAGYDISLITFSGIPFVSIPFTHDTSAVVQKLNHMSLADFPAAPEFLGTALGDALLLGAANVQRISTDQPGIVLLITDGDNNKGYDPADIFSLLRKKGISVRVLAIGQRDYLIGYDQIKEPVMTSLNIPLLQNIAQQTSGSFLHVLTTGDLQQFFSSFLTTVTSREISHIRLSYRYLDQVLLGLLLLGLLSLLCLYVDALRRQFHRG